MARAGRKFAVASLFTLVLAGCGTTTPVPQIPPGVTGGVAIGANVPAAAAAATAPGPAMAGTDIMPASAAAGATLPLAGQWILSGELGRRCALNLTATPSGQFYQAMPAGVCSAGFDRVVAWSQGNGQIFLFDAQGQLRGRLFPDGSGGFAGNFDDGVTASELVTFRRL